MILNKYTLNALDKNVDIEYHFIDKDLMSVNGRQLPLMTQDSGLRGNTQSATRGRH